MLPAYQLAPLGWLFLSVLLYLGGTHIREFLGRTRARPFVERILGSLAVRQLVELAYYLGIPYLALLRGDLLPRLMGLSDLRWLDDAGVGVAFGAGAALLAAVAFRYARGPQEPAGARRLPAAVALWQAAALQIHWTFYRAALVQATGEVYWGAFAGLLVAGFELALNPALRRRLRGPAGAQEAVRLGLLVVTTVQYLLARNLVLLIATHWLTELAVAAVYARGEPSTNEGHE